MNTVAEAEFHRARRDVFVLAFFPTVTPLPSTAPGGNVTTSLFHPLFHCLARPASKLANVGTIAFSVSSNAALAKHYGVGGASLFNSDGDGGGGPHKPVVLIFRAFGPKHQRVTTIGPEHLTYANCSAHRYARDVGFWLDTLKFPTVLSYKKRNVKVLEQLYPKSRKSLLWLFYDDKVRTDLMSTPPHSLLSSVCFPRRLLLTHRRLLT